MVEPKLFVILGSHACRSGILMLEHKGIGYQTVVLPTGLHPFALRLHGFHGNAASFRRLEGRTTPLLATADRMGTVPTLRVGDQWVSTNRAIARFLDELQPDPPLFPPDARAREAVEEAERWGDDVLQMVARRVVLGGSLHGRDALINRASDGRLGPLLFKHDVTRLIGARVFARSTFSVSERTERKLINDLPPLLDRIDAWIDAGVLSGEQLYAADFMIAPSLALLCYRRDVRSQLEQRPLSRLIDRVLPEPAYASPSQ
jgi:glutathione S-transferase